MNFIPPSTRKELTKLNAESSHKVDVIGLFLGLLGVKEQPLENKKWLKERRLSEEYVDCPSKGSLNKLNIPFVFRI